MVAVAQHDRSKYLVQMVLIFCILKETLARQKALSTQAV